MCRFNANPTKMRILYFRNLRKKKKSKFYVEPEMTNNSKAILGNKNKAKHITTQYFNYITKQQQ